MKKSERFLSCILLAIICNFIVSMPAQAGCGLATTHDGNITELSNLLPGDARGALAVDINALLSGSSATQVADLLNGTGGDPALKELFSAINELAENINLADVIDTALLVQTTDASDGFLLLAKLSCDTIAEVVTSTALTPDGAYGAGDHAMYLDVNDNSLSLLAGGVLVVGKLAAVQSVLDAADGSSAASDIDPFLSALQCGSPFSFVYGLPAMFNSAITPDRSLRGAELVSGSLDFSGSNISGSVSFHTSNASAFTIAYNDLNSAAEEVNLTLSDPIANGLSQVVVTIPSTPINKTGDDVINSRNTLKKLIIGMNNYDYAEDVEEGNQPMLALTVESVQDDPTKPGSVFIRWEFRPEKIVEFEDNELPAGFTLADCQFLESDEPGKFLVLNVYQSGGGSIVRGVRAEWDVFVHPPLGADPDAETRPRFMIIDALAESSSFNPLDGLTPPDPLSYEFVFSDADIYVGKMEDDVQIDVFEAAFPTPNPAIAPVARFTREMAIGNDYIYYRNGVYDRVEYNATTFNYDSYFVEPLSQVQITRNDHWAQYLEDEPTYLVYYVNTLEYIATPMENMDADYLDFRFNTENWMEELMNFKYNGHERTWMIDYMTDSFKGQNDMISPFFVDNETTKPATYYNFQITNPTDMATALNLPAGYSLAQTKFFESDTTEDYYLTLSVYEIKDAVEGTRAEWSVYVDNGNGRERLMIIDLQTEDAVVDPVSMINLPSKVDHNLSSGTLSTSLSSATIEFNGSFSTTGATEEAITMDWIEAGDYVCHLNGICDKLYYDAETLDVAVDVPNSPTVAISTPWNDFINTTPSAVFYRDNSQEYRIRPWYNLKVWVDDPIDPDPCAAEATHIINGTGTYIGRTSSAVNSTYVYFGSAVLDEDENELEYCYNLEITSQIGVALMRFTGSFDLTTGDGTRTSISCTPGEGMMAPLLCRGIIPNDTYDWPADNVDASDPDNITWNYITEEYIDTMGWVDSLSSLTAVRADCTDNDEDGFYIEGGVCGEIDCDDTDPLTYPGATEEFWPMELVPIDRNCNGNIYCFIGTAVFFGSP